MSKTKTLIVSSLAFSEQTELKRLALKAREGLILKHKKLSYASYALQQGASQPLTYAIIYEPPHESYLQQTMTRNGWSYVLSFGPLHYFSSLKPTFMTYDIAPKAQFYRNLGWKALAISVGAILLTLVLVWLFVTFKQPALTFVLFVLSFFSVFTSLFSGYVSLSYLSRARLLK